MDCDFGLQNDWNKIFRSLFHDLDHKLLQKEGLNCYYADIISRFLFQAYNDRHNGH